MPYQGCPGAPIQNNTNLNFNIELHRLFTYSVDFKNKCCVDPEYLAKAGFYCLNSNGDIRLRCNFCPKEIVGEEIRNVNELQRLKDGHDCCLNSADLENVPLNVKQLDFKFESHRLYSLLKKDVWEFITPAELAKDGFYYAGVEDICRCQYCNVEVRGWEEGDQARSEHQRWNADCLFLKNPSSVLNVPIGQELDKISMDRVLTKIPGNNFPFASVKELLNKFGANVTLRHAKVSPLMLNIQGWSKSRHPRYNTVAGRLETFGNWPKQLDQTPLTLALAGFFYTGRGDKVVCFHCNLGLKDWEPQEDPLKQHESYNANCQYLILTSREEIQKKNEEVDAENRRGSIMCVKCDEERVARVNLPCGHAHLCATCSDGVDGDCCSSCDYSVFGHVEFSF